MPSQRLKGSAGFRQQFLQLLVPVMISFVELIENLVGGNQQTQHAARGLEVDAIADDHLPLVIGLERVRVDPTVRKSL